MTKALVLALIAAIALPVLPGTAVAADGVASFWWNPTTGSVSSGYAGSPEEARGEARHACGRGACEEHHVESVTGYAGLATYHLPGGEFALIWGWGYGSSTELLRDLDEEARESGYGPRRDFAWERVR
jgi:hypothetical protein